MEPVRSLTSIVLSALVIAGSITLPIILVIFVIGVVRRSVIPQQREIQRLLAEAVELLKENNQLLKQASETRK